MAAPETTLRTATPEDRPAIETLMRVSGDVLFRLFYDERQAESAVRYVSTVDPMLLEDRTYFMIEAGRELVFFCKYRGRAEIYTGSGESDGDARLLDPATEPARVRAMFTRADWTRRGLGRRILEACEDAAAAEGFTRLSLMATLPGVPLYRAYGFEPVEEVLVTLPDGVTLESMTMEKPVTAHR